MMKMMIPMTINELFIPNISVKKPKINDHANSPNLAAHSWTPVTAPASRGSVYSETSQDMTGRINASPIEIPSERIMIPRNVSLSPSMAKRKERKRSVIRMNLLLLYLSAISPEKKLTIYGALITAKMITTCGREILFWTAMIGMKINPT